MMKFSLLLISCVALLGGPALSQEVIISEFPVGIGSSASRELIKPYYSQLKALADTLRRYPPARAVITGGADGVRYIENNDAKNPGLALGRAHFLRTVLINDFKVDSAQIIIQSQDVKMIGAQYRYVGVRIDRELSGPEARVKAVENQPPGEKHVIEPRALPVSFKEHLGLRLGIGLSSSPFGGVPIISGAITWKRIVYVEAMVGHTFWNSRYQFESSRLNTRRRLIGAGVLVYPFDHLPLGILGGWERIEEISQDYYQYVRLSEGPMLGLRLNSPEFLSVTGVYNPARQRAAGVNLSSSKDAQFLIFVTAHVTFGGAK
jgi:hypothetical protein